MQINHIRQLVVSVVCLGVVACQPVAAPAGVAPVTATATATSQPATTTPEETMNPAPTTPSAPESPHAQAVAQATEDLAQRLAIPVDQINVLEVHEVTWPDASLGCPQPDQMAAQVEQEGLLIRLGAGDEMYFYHSGGDTDPFLCEQSASMVPNTTPKSDEFVPPPDSEID